jgi:pimeloyl-ACP methyl ester carboxylesterase
VNDIATEFATVQLPGETPGACLARIAGSAELRRVSFGAGEMVWRIWGEGRPVIFLHGGYGTWMHWARNVLSLSRHFQVIVADMPAHGDADSMPRSTTREGMAEALARGFEGVLPKDEPYDLVGFSMGANLSAAAVAAYGRHPENLIAVGAGGLGIESQPVTGLMRWSRSSMPGIATTLASSCSTIPRGSTTWRCTSSARTGCACAITSAAAVRQRCCATTFRM